MNSFLRVLGYGVQGFRRNLWLSVIAIITLTMTLLTITAFTVGDIVATKKYQEFSQDKIDYVVYIQDSASDQDFNALYDQIKARPEVQTVTVVSKSDARIKFEQDHKDQPVLQGLITDDNNPLPRSIVAHFVDPNSISVFNTFISADRYKGVVDSTSYKDNATSIDNYLHFTKILRIFGLFFTCFFVLIAVLVVLNTIRLAIFARRTEIEVMRLVGATQRYIRGPFIVEGILFAVISTLISTILTGIMLQQIDNLVQQTTVTGLGNQIAQLFSSTVRMNGVSEVTSLLLYLFAIQLISGLVLATMCSMLAVRRYLKE